MHAHYETNRPQLKSRPTFEILVTAGWIVDWQDFCAKVVGATSSETFLVGLEYHVCSYDHNQPIM